LTADAPETPATESTRADKPARAPRRRRVHRSVLVALAASLVLLAVVAGAVRFGVLTDQGRAFALRTLEGTKIGRFGRLHVEGLQGDLFGAFSLTRVAILDERGPWFEVRNVAVDWRPLELSARRLHVVRLRSELMRVIRAPIQTPRERAGPGGLPVSIILDEVSARVETLPAFSQRLGVWDVAGQADIIRRGPATGRLDATSRVRQGDGLKLAFSFDPEGRMVLRLDAVEETGGALAGAVGLPADQRLFVRGRVEGVIDGEGRISMVTESGRLRPVTATGTWGPEGAALDAQVLLGASRLSAAYAARVGPEATVRLRARRGQGDIYQLDAAAVARDASMTLRGPLNWRLRQTDGMDLRVSVSEIERWVNALEAGPSRAAGVLSGTLQRWRYQGRMEIDRLDQFDYRATRFAGPATMTGSPQEVRLEADLTGAGGTGVGLVPALFGPTPRIQLDGARLRDGRLLARELHVTGAGLQVDASGDRSLLGVLSFKGTMALSRLERAHAGAEGVVRASWTATQRRLAPWSLRFDATGDDFATGYPELDRLLGRGPRLVGQAQYGPEGLAFEDAEITGEKAQATLRGRLGADSTLALEADWKAQGPFTAGPVEIAGEASGVGRIGGRLAAPWLDLTADLASLDLGRLVVKPARLTLLFSTEGGGAGQIAVAGPSEWGEANARAGFRFIEGGVALSDISADAGGVKAAGALTLRNGAPSVADLTIDASAGAFLASGRLSGTVRIAEARGGASARIVLDGQNLSAHGMAGSLKTLRVRADGPWARLPVAMTVDSDYPTPWRFLGDGTLTQVDGPAGTVRELSMSGTGAIRRAEVRTLEPAVIRLGPGERVARLRLGIGTGRLDLDAREAGGAMTAKAEASGLDLAPFNEDYVGRLTASLSLTGEGERLDGTLDAGIQDGRNRDAPESVALNGRVRAVLADSRIDLEATASNPQGLTSNLKMVVPAEAAASPFRVALVRNRPVSGQFSADGELRPLWDLFIGGGRTLSGRGSTSGTIAGTLADLDATGQAALTGGRFQDAATGLDLQALTLSAAFGESAINVNEFSGRDGQGGSLSGSGQINLARGGASTFQLTLDRFELIDNDLAKATASGAVTVTRDADGKAQIEGALSVIRADIIAEPPVPTGVVPLDVIEVNKPPASDSTFQVRPPGPQVALNVKITAPRGVFVRGNGLDIEFSVDAQVGGATGATTLTGIARVVRGNYQFAGKRFEFEERSFVRLGSRAEVIGLDLTAIREDPTLTALVRIEGTAARPEITLSSIPVLPQDEVLSQVLFGRTASQLAPLEAAQLASALAGLATGGGVDVLGGLREFARLDLLALGGDANGAATVSGGKYLTDDVYLELTGGGRDGPTAQVDWRVRRNFSVVSTVGTQGDARLSVRFRRGF
jgi:translocation and assembly module TamB